MKLLIGSSPGLSAPFLTATRIDFVCISLEKVKEWGYIFRLTQPGKLVEIK